MTAALVASGIRAIPTGVEHGTVTALVDGHGFEVTTLRRDVQTDGRHAVVAFTDDWQADAARRDFTINAMSMDRDGAVYDYFGGVSDVREGAVRFVGDAETRIAEDYLRVLRFFRFFGRYGRGEPDEATARALREAGPFLGQLSAERVWSELRRILLIPDCGTAIEMMHRLGILARVVPPPLTLDRFRRLLAMRAPVDPLLRLAALSEAETDAFDARYRLSSAEKERLDWLRGEAPADDADDLRLRQWLIDVPRPHLVRPHLAAGAGRRPARPRRRIAGSRLSGSGPRPVGPRHGAGAGAWPAPGRVARGVARWRRSRHARGASGPSRGKRLRVSGRASAASGCGRNPRP